MIIDICSQSMASGLTAEERADTWVISITSLEGADVPFAGGEQA